MEVAVALTDKREDAFLAIEQCFVWSPVTGRDAIADRGFDTFPKWPIDARLCKGVRLVPNRVFLTVMTGAALTHVALDAIFDAKCVGRQTCGVEWQGDALVDSWRFLISFDFEISGRHLWQRTWGRVQKGSRHSLPSHST